MGAPESIDLLSLVSDLKNGENTGYKTTESYSATPRISEIAKQ